MAEHDLVTVAITTYNKPTAVGDPVRSSMYLNIVRDGRDDGELQTVARTAMQAIGLLGPQTTSAHVAVMDRPARP